MPQASAPPDDLLSPAQAAALIGVSVDSIRRYANAGSLPSQRTPGNQRRFRRSDVDALLAPSQPNRDAT